MRYGFMIASLLFVGLMAFTGGSAPNYSMKRNISEECQPHPLGLFRQVTGSVMELSADYSNGLFLNKESDLKENRWTLDPLDRVDPAYKFDVLRSKSRPTDSKCPEKIEVAGKLISPSGEWFEFKQATFDFASRKLLFTTVERDGIKYEVEVQFYTESVLVKGMFQEGKVKLKASGKSLGNVSMEFPFTSWNNS